MLMAEWNSIMWIYLANSQLLDNKVIANFCWYNQFAYILNYLFETEF